MPFRSTQRTTIQTVPFCKTSNGNVFLSSTVRVYVQVYTYTYVIGNKTVNVAYTCVVHNVFHIIVLEEGTRPDENAFPQWWMHYHWNVTR